MKTVDAIVCAGLLLALYVNLTSLPERAEEAVRGTLIKLEK